MSFPNDEIKRKLLRYFKQTKKIPPITVALICRDQQKVATSLKYKIGHVRILDIGLELPCNGGSLKETDTSEYMKDHVFELRRKI